MLTDEDMAVLAHIVEDPDAWIDHVFAYCTQKATEAQAKVDELNALAAQGKQIDPRQRADWLSRADQGKAKDAALAMLFAKCRRDIHVANYRAAKAHPDYESWRGVKPKGPTPKDIEEAKIPAHAPRGKLPSARVQALVKNTVEAREREKAAQQDRINNLFN